MQAQFVSEILTSYISGMKMNSHLKGPLPALALLLSFSASACKPSALDFEICFDDASPPMGIENSTELVEGFFYSRDHLRITEAGIFALARKGAITSFIWQTNDCNMSNVSSKT
jgi:hypothetical protein